MRAVTRIREFRYDGAQARYLSAELDVAGFKQGSFVHTTRKWTDFDGDNAYRDRMMTPGDLAYATGFEPGIGRIRDMAGTPKGDYYFADHLGTTRRTHGPSGGSSSSVFTAFGEPRSATLDGGDNRYGYVGAHGYQAHDEMPFLHVGHRYYDPSIGRFLQRDPIGIRAGGNVYSYVRNRATVRVDPLGLFDTKECDKYCGGKFAKCKQEKTAQNIMCTGNFNECRKNCQNKASECLNDDSYDPGLPPYPNPNDPEKWDPWPDVAVEEDEGCGDGGGTGGAATGTLFILFAVRFGRRRQRIGHH